MNEITTKMMADWLNQTEIQAINPNTLIISKPDKPYLLVDNEKVFLTGNYVVCSVMGIEICVDDSISKNKAYLIDKNTFEIIGDV